METNSAPNVAASTVFCRLLNAVIGVLLRKMTMPVWDRRVTRLPAWLESQKQMTLTGFPRDVGALCGDSSSKLP